MNRPFSTISAPILGLLALIVVVPLVQGCDSFELQWTPMEDTVALYSLDRPEYVDMPSAFDFYSRRLVVVEQPKPGDPADFDVALAEEGSDFVFLPAGLFETFTINPGVMAIDSAGVTFDNLAQAPATGYVTDAPVVLELGVVYAVRTRRDRGGCTRYGKFEILDMDPAGLVEFRQVRNSLCNDRELIPPDQR